MTTEDDFQRQLDLNPDDWQTRLVFADFLQERGDPRADGYRALAVLGVHPHTDGNNGWCHTANYHNRGPRPSYGHCALPPCWYDAISPAPSRNDRSWREGWESRRKAEDAAALAFARLPADRRAELLAGTTEGVPS
jgi:uncharacterized protein (TIGR02996 family)